MRLKLSHFLLAILICLSLASCVEDYSGPGDVKNPSSAPAPAYDPADWCYDGKGAMYYCGK